MKHLPQFLVFCIIGLLNTLVDVVLFVALRANGLPVFSANVCSASAALVVSFVLNSKFTFRSAVPAGKALLPFLIVTLTGIWLLQPLVIAGLLAIMDTALIGDVLARVPQYGDTMQNTIAKLASTPASLLWNYFLYKRFVFKASAPVRAI